MEMREAWAIVEEYRNRPPHPATTGVVEHVLWQAPMSPAPESRERFTPENYDQVIARLGRAT